MKKRSPIITYLFFWLTIGFYFFYWIYQLMKEINILSGETKFDLRKVIRNTLIILIPDLIIQQVMSYTFRSPYFFLLFAVGFILSVLWIVMIVRYLYQIGNAIALLENNARFEKKASGGLVILLFFLYFTAIPYIQSHMNKVIDFYGNEQSS